MLIIKKKIIPYNPRLIPIAGRLRKQRILSEVLLWSELKGKKMMGYDFHRQKPLDEYIVNFFCNELMLIIEVDGASHNDEDTSTSDEVRQKKLESYGLRFLRYYDGYVKNYLGDVLNSIRQWLKEHEND